MDPVVKPTGPEREDGLDAASLDAPQRTMTRREAIRYGATGLACVAGASGLAWYLFRQAREEIALTGVFRGGGPSDAVWTLWRQRGWVKEAAHYLQLGSNVQCKLCPNNCILAPGDRSHCRNKVNRGGTLYTMAYANPCTFHVDPVEKKPLFHFHPGMTTFSLATSGCGFRCLNCQNWEISQKQPEETKDPTGPALRLRPPLPASLSLGELQRLTMLPEDVVAVAEAMQCPSIAYTYSEPTDSYEYVSDTAHVAHAHNLKNIFVTCGFINEAPLRDLATHLDAAHVDLKGFDDDVYKRLDSGHLQPILDTLVTLKQMDVWFEVINLVVPTYTDDLDTIKRMCDWLVNNIGPDHPLHFSRFHPAHKLEHLPPTPVDTLVDARDIARRAGLRYVYVGNVRGLPDAETTFCPNCHRAIVERDIFAVTRLDVADGKCKFCQTRIAGVWA
jgi:pyruvate formate lyase activating enzyme